MKKQTEDPVKKAFKWVDVVLFIILFGIISTRFYINQVSPQPTERQVRELSYAVSEVEENLRNMGLKFKNADVYLTELNFLPDTAVAVTRLPFLLNRWIEVRRSYFASAPVELREAVILHEYGHYLGLEHDSTYGFSNQLDRFCPSSIMHPSDEMRMCFLVHKNYYYLELVRKVNKLHK